MRAASLCIGVCAYEHPAYGAISARLKYASGDAAAFSAYANSASPGPDADQRHRLVLDGDAVVGRIHQAFEDLRQLVELELFILYLAGHGERGTPSTGGWFCLADAIPDQPSLNARTLDDLLKGIRADKVLVVVDCCHAAALLDKMRTFSSLGDRRALLYIASARADQLAWEDDRLQRSVFSDVFLRACSTASPIQNSAGLIPVEAALFPYLREQVPLLAAAQKQGAVQEPVTGCVAQVDVELPTVSSKSFGRSLTIAQTVRQRLRQVLVKSAVAVVVVVVAIEMLTYHVAVDYAGRIMVRPGLRPTHALLPAILAKDLDTGFRPGDLSAASRSELGEIADGKLWGFATHKDSDGSRPWFSRLVPLLDPDARARAEMLVRGRPKDRLSTDSPPPTEQYLFQVLERQLRAAASQDEKLKLAQAIYELRFGSGGGCQSKSNFLDFSLFNSSGKAFVRDLWWMSATVGLRSFDDQINFTGYRAGSTKEADAAVFDLRALTLSIALFAVADRANPVEPARLRGFLSTSCRPHAAVAQRLVGPSSMASEVEAAMVADVLGFDRDKQGDLPTVSQALAAEALALMSAGAPLSADTVQSMARASIDQDPSLERNTLPLSVLRAAAQHEALPPFFIGHLFEVLEAAESFGQMLALDVLSRNVAFLQPKEQQRLTTWLEANAKLQSRMSEVQAAIGKVLRWSHAQRPELVGLLVARLSPHTLLPVPTSGYRGEMVIAATDDAAAIALGRALQSIPLAPDVVDQLAAFAMARGDAEDRQEILDGLARSWYAAGLTSVAIHRRLERASGDARRRHLEVEVACSGLVLAPKQTRDSTTAELLQQWAQEPEPELRSSIALVVARGSWPRYAGMTMCSGM